MFPDRWWSNGLFPYLKRVGASFEGAAAIFGDHEEIADDIRLAEFFECLKFCIENDPIFPTGFSASSALDKLLQCDYHRPPPAMQLSLVEYIHQVAVKHNLLAPDATTGDSLLTVVVRHLHCANPEIQLSDISGKPILDLNFNECNRQILEIVAPTDPQKLFALFEAIKANAFQAVDYLCREFKFDLLSVRDPTSGDQVWDFATKHCERIERMRDYLTIVGVFNDVRPSGESPLKVACCDSAPTGL